MNTCTCDFPDGLADETIGCPKHDSRFKKWNFHWERTSDSTWIGHVRIDGDHKVVIRVHEPVGFLCLIWVRGREFSADWTFTMELSANPTLRDQVETIVTGILAARGYDPEATRGLFTSPP